MSRCAPNTQPTQQPAKIFNLSQPTSQEPHITGKNMTEATILVLKRFWNSKKKSATPFLKTVSCTSEYV